MNKRDMPHKRRGVHSHPIHSLFRLADMYNLVFIPLFVILLTSNTSGASECDATPVDDVSFATKVRESPIIVTGIALNKNYDAHIRHLFNVTFLVECILKGQPTPRIIHIVQAGLLLGRRTCQRLDVNRQFIVFLEPFFDETYRPVDFEEVPYGNSANTLLEKTCGLSRTYPFTDKNATGTDSTSKCPSAVSIDCPPEIPTTSVSTTTTTTTTTTTEAASATSTLMMILKNTIDLQALSIMLAERDQQQFFQQNISLAFLQGQNHKSLFSDDETRKNNGMQFVLPFYFIFSSSLLRIFL